MPRTRKSRLWYKATLHRGRGHGEEEVDRDRDLEKAEARDQDDPVVRARPEGKVMVTTTDHGEEENPRKPLDRKREPPLPGRWTRQGVREGVLRPAAHLEGLREGKNRDQDYQKAGGHTHGTAFWTWPTRKSSRSPMSMASQKLPGLTFGPRLTSSNRGNKSPCSWNCYACSA